MEPGIREIYPQNPWELEPYFVVPRNRIWYMAI